MLPSALPAFLGLGLADAPALDLRPGRHRTFGQVTGELLGLVADGARVHTQPAPDLVGVRQGVEGGSGAFGDPVENGGAFGGGETAVVGQSGDVLGLGDVYERVQEGGEAVQARRQARGVGHHPVGGVAGVGWRGHIAAPPPPQNRACHSSRHTAQASPGEHRLLTVVSDRTPWSGSPDRGIQRARGEERC